MEPWGFIAVITKPHHMSV